MPDEHDSLAASLSSFSDPMWQVKDRSVAGLRIAASGGIGQALALGALVAVRQSDVSDWVLGVVRRLNKVSNDEVEAGMSIIADRIVPVTLHAVRQAKDDMGFVVDGIDVSTIGARFDGLYLPPPSRPDKPLAVKTLIVPTQEYSEGRNVILTTGPLGLHGRVAPPGRAARRLELGGDPDHREEIAGVNRYRVARSRFAARSAICFQQIFRARLEAARRRARGTSRSAPITGRFAPHSVARVCGQTARMSASVHRRLSDGIRALPNGARSALVIGAPSCTQALILRPEFQRQRALE